MSAAQILAERMYELRMESKLPQDDVADRIGVKRPAYSHYETRRRQPDVETIVAFADLFGVSVDYLFGRTNERS